MHTDAPLADPPPADPPGGDAGSDGFAAALLAGAGLAIVGVRPDGTITSWNPAAAALYGHHADDVIGQPVDLLAPDGSPALRQLVTAAVTDGTIGQLDATHRTHRELPVEVAVTVSPAVDTHGVTIGVSLVVRDRTAQLATERANDARVAASHAAALRAQLRQSTEDVTEAEQRVLSRLSHELRTPLHAVIGFAQALETEPDLSADARAALAHIRRAGDELVALVDEVLDLTSSRDAEAGDPSGTTRLRPLLDHAVAQVRTEAAHRGVTVLDPSVAPDAGAVRAERGPLLQVLSEVLTNAVRYSRPGGCVRIAVTATARGAVRITVRDDGWGIAADLQQRAFAPFERLDAERHGVAGTGLGLTRARALARAMDGDLYIAYSGSLGSALVLDLPGHRGEPVSRDPADRPSRRESEAAMRVIYVEDNDVSAELVRRTLCLHRKAELMWARDGRSGLEAIRRHRPDLVLLDLHLPDIHGATVLEQIRSEPTTRAVPVAVLTADARPEERHRLLQLGADWYLTKPLDLRQLLDLVEPGP